VSQVQDQLQCNSGWAFAAAGALESVNAIASGEEVDILSKQQLIDCDKFNDGCNGGSPEIAFMYYEKHPAMRESQYFYTGRTGECKHDPKNTKSGVTIDSYSYIAKGDQDKLEEALCHQPVVVGLDVTQLDF